MDENTKEILSNNLKLLMKNKKCTQVVLHQKSGVDQKTISNIINPDATKNGPTLVNITAVANAFGLETWHLLIKDLPIDVLLSKSLEKMVHNYVTIDKSGRENLERIAKNEVRYCSEQQTKDKIING